MNTFQEEVIKLIHHSLSSEEFYNNLKENKDGYKEVFKQFIRQYSGISSTGKNTWKKVDLYKKHHKITERAARIIDTYQGKPNELWKKLHYEHIYPISQVVDALVRLEQNPDIDKIKEIMEKNEVIILSKEEANVLDGSPKKLYELDGKQVEGKGLRVKGTPEERLKAIDATIDKRYSNNSL
jgi:hypothetical protein